jgi:alanyl-tRNA synthetase
MSEGGNLKMKETLKTLSTNEIRKKWLDFFQQKGYYFIKPASLVPQNDPSLL